MDREVLVLRDDPSLRGSWLPGGGLGEEVLGLRPGAGDILDAAARRRRAAEV